MAWHLTDPLDIPAHNAAVDQVWEAYRAGRPTRVPVSVGGSIRNYIQNPALNDTGYTFEDFFEDPEAQVRCQLEYQHWCRHHLLCDRPMGLPEAGWQLSVDFQNSLDAGFLGCPLLYRGNAVPDTGEILRADKRRLYQLESPDPLRGGLMARAVRFRDYMVERCARLEFHGRPVHPPAALPGEGCDGPLSAAYKLRGAAEVCLDMVDDPAYYHDLMEFVTTALIGRMRALREWRWAHTPAAPDRGQYRQPGFFFADDAIVLLSLDQYRQFVFPYHQRLVDAFSDGGPTGVHLCGDAARFFRFLRDRLRVQRFDTGYPLDLGAVRRELGPQVELMGGPPVTLLQQGPPAAIGQAVQRVCASGVMEGGRFILIAANNLAPCTPVEHVVAFYRAACQFGRYDR
jgi:hypothetical protein